MALVLKDRVKETTLTTGTGSFALAGAVTGYDSFGQIGNSNTTYYAVYLDGGSEWEVGIGTYTSPSTLSRDTILASSNAGSVVTFSAGQKTIWCDYPAGAAVYASNNGSQTSGQALKSNGVGVPPTWQNITNGTVTSVGLTTSAASLALTNTPITSSGNIGVNFAGLSSQYVRGDGALANFPTTGGGGSSVAYYFNGSVNQGTFGGATYYEMSKTPVFGAGTNFSIAADGYIAQFITDANDPALLAIPAGSWNIQLYFSSSSAGGSPSYYVELYKYNGTTFTLIASNSANPEGITGGVSTDLYSTSLGVPATTLTVTDRLAIRVYVAHSGRTITLHTEGSTLCEVITTFSTGLNALNGLTAQVQYFATGTSGSDFNISSATDTHTFNLPSASGSNRGLLTSADWTTFNGKGTVSSVSATAGTGISIGGSPITGSGTLTITNTAPDQIVSLTNGTGISTSGAYPNFTITNTAPDQTVAIASGTGISVTGTYPSFTVTNTAPAVSFTYTTNYIPFGQGTTTPNQSANLTFDGTSLTAPVQRASNGIVTNNKTIGTSFTIPSTDNATSAGPVTLSSGVVVTVSSGSRWVVL
jgi:hypothetical protein